MDMTLPDTDRPVAAATGGGGKLADEDRMCFMLLLMSLSLSLLPSLTTATIVYLCRWS
jgi:hypothetical protein